MQEGESVFNDRPVFLFYLRHEYKPLWCFYILFLVFFIQISECAQCKNSGEETTPSDTNSIHADACVSLTAQRSSSHSDSHILRWQLECCLPEVVILVLFFQSFNFTGCKSLRPTLSPENKTISLFHCCLSTWMFLSNDPMHCVHWTTHADAHRYR